MVGGVWPGQETSRPLARLSSGVARSKQEAANRHGQCGKREWGKRRHRGRHGVGEALRTFDPMQDLVLKLLYGHAHILCF